MSADIIRNPRVYSGSIKTLIYEIFWRAGVTAIFFAFAMILAVAAHGQDKPIYCQAPVIQAMNHIWTESDKGRTGVEATFIINGTPRAYHIVQMPMTYEKIKQSVYVYPGATFALYHVHPGNTGQFPSTPMTSAVEGISDTASADKGKFDIYVVHQDGLSVYYWQTKEIVLLRKGMSWTSRKGCV